MSTAIPTLTTDRLTLRGATAADFDAYAATLADMRSQYMGGPYTRRGAWDMFCNMTAQWQLSGYGGWIIETDQGFAGEIAFWHPPHFPEPELGWTLTAQAEGHGYAREAARAALVWYWANTNAVTVVSYIDPKNARSIALATKLGAQPDPDGPWAEGENAANTTVYRHRRPS
ncbi:MAG: GNAT family N-acetyltransferase [Pseudomonadota bacterium]